MNLILKRIFPVLLLLVLVVSGWAQSPVDELLKKVETAKDSNKVKAYFDVCNYYLSISRFDSNKYYLNKALEEANRCNYEHGKSRVYTGLGYMYKADAEYDKALELFFNALHIKEKLQRPLEAAALHTAIGSVYIDLQKPANAFEHFVLAKNVYETYKDSARLLPLFSEIGGYYVTIKDYPKAIEWYEKALKVMNEWQQSGNPKLNARFLGNYKTNALTNYAYTLIESGRAPEAVTILEPLLKERKKIQGGVTSIPIQSFLALAQLRVGNYQEALRNCEEGITAIKQSPNMKLLDLLRDFYYNAAEANYALGNYKNGYDDYSSYKTISDSINNDKAGKQIAEMQVKYETEKKDEQITYLDQKRKSQRSIILLSLTAAVIALGLLIFFYRSRSLQQKLFRQKEQLVARERQIEKDALEKKMTGLEQMALRAQMNPHFIFNCLNSVQHFILKHDIEGVNKYLGTFAHLIRQTLDNSSRQLISLNEEIEYLSTYLNLEKMKSDNKFRYEINVAGNVDKHTVQLPGMILQPFVENSIKHGINQKPNETGEIKINITQNGRLSCTIEDNGMGRARAASMKTDQPAMYGSKGLSLTLSRIDIINRMYNADISTNTDDITDKQGNVAGTKVVIEFPLNIE